MFLKISVIPERLGIRGYIKRRIKSSFLGYLSRFTEELYLFGNHGVLKSTRSWPDVKKRDYALWWQNHERGQIALAVAQFYPGGDYLEFGSDGLATFRSFLSACDIYGVDQRFPDIEFHAFDIFGTVDFTKLGKEEREYFSGWLGESKLQEAHEYLANHDLFVDKCKIHAGLFQHTLPPLVSRYSGDRKIGFAYLDCNITESYEYIFGQLGPLIHPMGYVYMDEYYLNQNVPFLFERFLDEIKQTRGIQGAQFIRNAGAFGALYKLEGSETELMQRYKKS